MIFDRNEKKQVVALLGAGSMGTAIVRRIGAGKKILLGIIVTPLAYDEFRASGEGYQAMIDASAAQRTGTSDEIAEAAAFLLGEHARFITGTDLLIDGGVIASIRTGEFKLWQ